jgi:ketosteroid isomerase-like protein
MAQDLEQFVRSAYAWFNREKTAFPHLWHADGEYINSRQDPDHGIHRGIDAISRLTSSWVESYPDLEVHPVEVRLANERAFVWTRWSGHGAGSDIPIEMELAHVITVEAGQIRRIEEYFDRAEALAAAGLEE